MHTRTELSSRDKRTTFTNGPTLIMSKNILQERAQFGNFLKSPLVHFHSADFSTFKIKSFSNLYHASSPIRIKLLSSHCTIVSVLSIISYDVLFHFFKHKIIACTAQLYEDHLVTISFNKMGSFIYFLPFSSNKMCEAPAQHN